MMPRSKGPMLSDEAGSKTFAPGLLPDFIALLRRVSRKGDDTLAVTGSVPNIGSNLSIVSVHPQQSRSIRGRGGPHMLGAALRGSA